MAHNEAVDVVLVGAGIMSATLAVLLKELDPGMSLEVVEQMTQALRRVPTRGTTLAPAMPDCAN